MIEDSEEEKTPTTSDKHSKEFTKLSSSPLQKVMGDSAPNFEDRKRYSILREDMNLRQCLNKFFSDETYKAEILSHLQALPSYTLQAYKYRIEAFSSGAQKKCLKDLLKYPSNFPYNFLDKKTLCLDVKNVLMMVSMFVADNADAVLPINEEKGHTGEIALFYRPLMRDFLEEIKGKYELIMYSSLSKTQLKVITDHLEELNKYFDYIFDETYCVFANVSYGVKCIDFLSTNRSPADIIVVDTTAEALPLSPDNLIPISRYEGDTNDTELPKLAAVLDVIQEAKDVRVAIKKYRESTEKAQSN